MLYNAINSTYMFYSLLNGISWGTVIVQCTAYKLLFEIALLFPAKFVCLVSTHLSVLPPVCPMSILPSICLAVRYYSYIVLQTKCLILFLFVIIMWIIYDIYIML